MATLKRGPVLVTAALATIAAAAWLIARPATRAQDPPGVAQGNVVRQGFPARSADRDNLPRSDSAWVVKWSITQPQNGPNTYSTPASVLKIDSAQFMHKDKDNQPRWITVLRNLELGEVFVPYDPGSPRYMDVAQMPFWVMPADRKLLGPPCVAVGEILGSEDARMANKVYKEVHDDGIRWLADGDGGGRYGTQADRGRRGEKMLLWAVFYGANYRYIMEYGFSDDGTVSARVGATARNLRPRQPDGSDTHLHVGCWMFEPDLGDPADPANGGPESNVVQLVRRAPQVWGVPDGRYRVDVRPFGTPPGTPAGDPAFEGGAEWVPEEFTTLRVESTVRKNRQPTPRATSYDLVPLRYGVVRGFPASLEFINKDFWVTAEVSSSPRYNEVQRYVQTPPRAVNGKPVTVWHNAPLLHVVRSEDLNPNGVSNYPHVALTAWAGFSLKPRNLFDSTPLFTPLPRREAEEE